METIPARKRYPDDVSDEEWAFVAPYLTLMREDAPQRDHDLREVFTGLRWVVERSFAWLTRCRRLAKDYERLPRTVAGLHLVAFATLMLGRMVKLLLSQSAYHPLGAGDGAEVDRVERRGTDRAGHHRIQRAEPWPRTSESSPTRR